MKSLKCGQIGTRTSHKKEPKKARRDEMAQTTALAKKKVIRKIVIADDSPVPHSGAAGHKMFDSKVAAENKNRKVEPPPSPSKIDHAPAQPKPAENKKRKVQPPQAPSQAKPVGFDDLLSLLSSMPKKRRRLS